VGFITRESQGDAIHPFVLLMVLLGLICKVAIHPCWAIVSKVIGEIGDKSSLRLGGKCHKKYLLSQKLRHHGRKDLFHKEII
jgi:hypothetical protein